MFTTTDERGIMNNYAIEPSMYEATFPSVEKQRNYLLQGAMAVLFVSSLVLTTIFVS